MPRKFTDTFIDNAHKLMLSGLRLNEIAKSLGCNPDHLSIHLRKAGYQIIRWKRKPHNRKQLDEKLLVEQYIAGKSVLFLAKKFNIARHSINLRLKENGIKLRNGSEANTIRMRNLTKDQRKELAKKANSAVRGKPKRIQTGINRAITRQKIKSHIGIGEDLLSDILTNKYGFSVIQQAAVNVYNIDLLVNDSIAVELISATLSNIQIKKNRKKIEYLLKSGFNVFVLAFRDIDCIINNIDEVITNINSLRSNQASISQYRVIWCAFDSFIRRRDKLGRFTCIKSPKKFYCIDKTADFSFSC